MNVGNTPEFLARVGIGNMHLNGRNPNRLDRVQQRDARMCIRTGIDHDAVRASIGGLNRVHQRALVVALETLNRYAERLCLRPNEKQQVAIRPFSVDLRLAQPQQVQIRSVQH